MTLFNTVLGATAVDNADFLTLDGQLPARLFLDIKAGVISPATSLRCLKRQYGVADEAEFINAMRDACRWDASLHGSVVIVSDGDSGEIIEQSPLPYTVGGYGGRSPAGLGVGLSAMTRMLDRNIDYFEARDFLLHVHVMPKARYHKQQGRHVALLGELLLTYKGWDKEAQELGVPFPDDIRFLDDRVCYQYSPLLGYTGFDGQRWRCEWFKR